MRYHNPLCRNCVRSLIKPTFFWLVYISGFTCLNTNKEVTIRLQIDLINRVWCVTVREVTTD